MTMKCIIYTRPDGGVSTVVPALGARFVRRISRKEEPDNIHTFAKLSRRLDEAFAVVGLGRGWSAEKMALVTVIYDETEAEFLARIQAGAVPSDAADVEIVEQATIPKDRWFRSAWAKPVSGGAIEIDMPKAREIQAAKICRARGKEIIRLQREEDKARLVGQTADADKHAADRAALETMDLAAVATSIAGASNPTALKAVWPAGQPSQE